MRKIVLAVGCLCLLAAPAWAGGGFSLFGTYGQINDNTSSGGLGARVSFGGQKLVVDVTATWFPERSGAIINDGGYVINDSLQIYPIEVGLRYLFAPGEEFRPYVGAGASWILTDLQGGSRGSVPTGSDRRRLWIRRQVGCRPGRVRRCCRNRPRVLTEAHSASSMMTAVP
jgi:hypothetical protein